MLSRPRLLELLRGLLDYKLILVVAQAGYGKTSLLLDFVHRVELPVCWLALDELDRDLHRFLVHFIAALAQRFPGFGRQSLAILENGSSGTPDVSRLVTTIVNELYEQVGQRFLLVLDDYHLVDGSGEVGRFVSQFIQSVDENCHLVIASRALLTLPDLPLMVSRSQVAGLDSGDLAFRPDEIQAFVLQNYRATISDAIAEELAVETEGWIAGLLLSTQAMWQGMPDRVRTARASGVGLYDFLAHQVLDQQPAPIRQFLLRTSLLEEFDATLCTAVLGPVTGRNGQDWHGLVESVLRHNLFVLPVGEDGSWLRYHHLFRDFLQARLAHERPDEAQVILRRLADFYRERKEWDRAHAVYRRLGDMGAVAGLIEDAGSSLVARGRFATLGAWLDGIPAEVFAARPELISLRATVVMVLGEPSRALSLLDHAAAAFEAAGNLPRLARTLTRRSVAHRFLGSYEAALADADRVLALTQDDDSLCVLQAEALRTKGTSLARLGRLNEATMQLSEALAAYRALREEANVAILLMELGVVYQNVGRYKRALAHYESALDSWRCSENMGAQANVLNNLGVLYHLHGDYERAADLLEEALANARRGGDGRVEAFSLASLGDLYIDLDAPTAAQAAYALARDTAERIENGFLLFYLDVVQASAARMRGELDRAADLLDAARRRASRSDSNLEVGLYAVEAGRLVLARDEALRAVSHLEEACRRFLEGSQPVESARARLLLAVANYDAGRIPLAFEYLDKAFSLASTLETNHRLVIAGREAKTVLTAAQADPVLGRKASQLLEQVIRFEQRIPTLRRRLRGKVSTVPFAPPKLIIRALGRTQVLVDTVPVTSAEWESPLARDLFFYLLNYPGGLDSEELAAVFWPDDSPTERELKFKKTLSRLCGALGPQMILCDGERYWFNREGDYEYDVESFRRNVGQAQTAIDIKERATAYAEAVQLYRGVYLPGVGSEWVRTERERLRQTYVESLVTLAELHLA
ncbi:MAG TPA: tetratricopeptide repeat protein, partial [Ardenticatenaceae bacterium]|nr:tetratricopeptide repeat protein [Ardenticatenaceae bacterium]